jgi:hypothetical protein
MLPLHPLELRYNFGAEGKEYSRPATLVFRFDRRVLVAQKVCTSKEIGVISYVVDFGRLVG